MNVVQPIKDVKKINQIKKVLKAQSSRDYLLFTMGINIGLRISDLLKLKVLDVIDQKGRILKILDMHEKKSFPVNSNTRKAIQEHIQTNQLQPDSCLFQSRKGENQPITRIQAWNILKSSARTVGITDGVGSHILRKTFAYHAYKQGTDIALLQEILNHSSIRETRRYIGITQDDIECFMN
jgi:site-specific recombinase XerD